MDGRKAPPAPVFRPWRRSGHASLSPAPEVLRLRSISSMRLGRGRGRAPLAALAMHWGDVCCHPHGPFASRVRPASLQTLLTCRLGAELTHGLPVTQLLSKGPRCPALGEGNRCRIWGLALVGGGCAARRREPVGTWKRCKQRRQRHTCAVRPRWGVATCVPMGTHRGGKDAVAALCLDGSQAELLLASPSPCHPRSTGHQAENTVDVLHRLRERRSAANCQRRDQTLGRRSRNSGRCARCTASVWTNLRSSCGWSSEAAATQVEPVVMRCSLSCHSAAL